MLDTLPYKTTELRYCFSSGPTSDKSLGILFILSLNKTVKAVSFVSSLGNKPLSIPPATAPDGRASVSGKRRLVAPDCPGYPLSIPGRYTL